MRKRWRDIVPVLLLLLPLLHIGCTGGAADQAEDTGGQDAPGTADTVHEIEQPDVVIIGPKDSVTQEVDAGWPEDLEEADHDLPPSDVTDPDGGDLDADPQDVTMGWECEAEGGPGCPCQDNADCTSAWCVPTGDGKVCTKDCVEDCPDGWDCAAITSTPPDIVYVCIPTFTNLCRPCNSAADCTQLGDTGGYCVPFPDGAGSFCGGNCEVNADCPDGYACQKMDVGLEQQVLQCVPKFGQCDCNAKAVKDGANTDCFVANEFGSCSGARMCTADGLTECDADTPAAEECNGVDDNCSGLVDDGLEQECESENESGICSGVIACVDGQWSDCDAPTPAPEACDGADNDCNGVVDDLSEPCQKENEFGLCAGILACVDGNWVACDAPEPAPEVCDGLDNDCDELVDEEFTDIDQDGSADCVDEDDDDDGVLDWLDNCPTVANPGQEDDNKNGVGDACDDDPDDDLIPDDQDNCPDVSNPGQEDFDEDGLGDACDDDDDNDGTDDVLDCAPFDDAISPDAVELCNDIDDNCNDQVDELFPEVGEPCDGDDVDKCENGIFLCAENQTETTCSQEEPADLEELCHTPEDDDCDGAVNEGCAVQSATVTFASGFVVPQPGSQAAFQVDAALAETAASGTSSADTTTLRLGYPTGTPH